VAARREEQATGTKSTPLQVAQERLLAVVTKGHDPPLVPLAVHDPQTLFRQV